MLRMPERTKSGLRHRTLQSWRTEPESIKQAFFSKSERGRKVEEGRSGERRGGWGVFYGDGRKQRGTLDRWALCPGSSSSPPSTACGEQSNNILRNYPPLLRENLEDFFALGSQETEGEQFSLRRKHSVVHFFIYLKENNVPPYKRPDVLVPPTQISLYQ